MVESKEEGENVAFFGKAAEMVGKGYAKIAQESVKTVERQVMDLMNHRAMPVEGWERITIESMMNRIAMMDSNNY